jgi:thioesterase domain-containing protein
MKVGSLPKQADIIMTVVDLFEHSTIASLVAYVEQGKSDTAVKGAIPVRTAGSERPLFLIHDNTGQGLWFPLLAAQIDSEIPVYGLPGVPLDEPQLQTIEGMAARLVKIMRTVQPVGPYRFAGWSLGGVLAYEVAIQLIGQDQIVEFAGLIDAGCPVSRSGTNPPQARNQSSQTSLLGLCEWLAREASLTAEHRLTLSGLKKVANELDFEELFRQCRESGVLHESLVNHSAKEIEPRLVRLMAHAHANENYVAKPAPITIYLFTAEEQPDVPEELAPPDPLMGWGSVIPERQIHLIRAPGIRRSLMDDPHVGALGRALSIAIGQASGQRPDLPEMQYRPHVTLQVGKRSNTPVFCVPGAGDNVIGFLELARAIGSECPVYGLQPRGVEGALVPHSTVEAAATMYLKAIDTIQPDGQAHLIGHSFGGWVAFEIATQMRASGRSVASLTIIDSEAPCGNGLLGRAYTSTEVMVELIEIMELAADKSLGVHRAEFESQNIAGQLRLLHEGMLRVGLMPRRSTPDALRGPVRTFGTALRARYRPQGPLPDPVRLALVRDPRLDDQSDQRERQAKLEWWRLWSPNITCWHGPGNHFSILKPPHVHVLADWWRNGLPPGGKKDQ